MVKSTDIERFCDFFDIQSRVGLETTSLSPNYEVAEWFFNNVTH